MSPRQREALRAVHCCLQQNGITPTINELRTMLGVSSDQSVLELLSRLEAKGLVMRTKGKARSVRMTEQGLAALGAEAVIATERPDRDSRLIMAPTRQLIAKRLADIDPKLRRMYEGSLYVLRDRDNPERIHQSAHSIRELTASLSRLAKDQLTEHRHKTSTASTNKQLLKLSFDPHGGAPYMDENVYGEWNSLHEFFNSVGHHRPVTDEEYDAKLTELEEILANYVLPLQQDVYGRLDKYIHQGPPARDARDLWRLLSRNRESYGYFFRKIDSAWLPFLKERKLIHPSREVAEYLARIASDSPEYVMTLIQTLNTSQDDWAARRALVEAALRVPGQMAARLIGKIKKESWIRSASAWALLPPLTDLFAKLVSEAQFREAKLLAECVLSEIVPEDRAAIRDDTFQLGELLKGFTLVPGENLKSFAQLLVSCLVRAIRSQHSSPNLSSISRPAIEPSDQNWNHPDIPNQLVDAVRDSIERYIERLQPSDAREFIQETFRDEPYYSIFKRLKLHVYRLHPAWFKDEIDGDILALLDEKDTWHEYALLIRRVFPEVSRLVRQRFLKLIDEGPRGERGEEYIRFWKRRRLALVRDALSPDERCRYAPLLGEGNAESSPDDWNFLTKQTFWFGPTSPYSEQELLDMPLNQLIDHLITWQPSEQWGCPSSDGLGRQFAQAVLKTPEKFLAGIELFVDPRLKPVYLCHLLFGIREALKTAKEMPWDDVLNLLRTIVDRAKLSSLTKSGAEFEPDWTDVFKEIGALIQAGLSPHVPVPVGPDARDVIWEIVQFLCEHPEPTPEYEREFGLELVTMSINAVRGRGFHALFAYIFWWDRHFGNKGHGRIPPEAKPILEMHLDPMMDSSSAVRSVYGDYFPWLFSYDPEWARSLVEPLFPAANPVLRYAAWETYLARDLFDEVFRELKPQYQTAINDLNHRIPERKYWSDPSQGLAKHMMIAYIHGLDDELCRSFFATATPELRGAAVSYAGRALCKDNRSDRLHKFWEWRLSVSRNLEELREFGWWIQPDRFDNEWMLDKLLRTLKITNGDINPQFTVLQVIAALSKDYSLTSVRILECIVRSRAADRLLLMHNESLFDALSRIRAFGNSEAVGAVELLVDYLTKLGFESYRTIVTMATEDLQSRLA